MSAPSPRILVEPFAVSGARNAVPFPDGGGSITGAASYELGFPPVTMIAKMSGGKPPDGLDVNGVLYDVSANIVWQTGGGGYFYSATFAATNTGYAAGSALRSSASVYKYWLNTTADNAIDPDVTPTGWVPFAAAAQPLGVQSFAPIAGTTATLTLSTGVGFLDCTPAGDATITNLSAGYDGQNLIVSNLHATRLLTLSSVGNMRLPFDMTLTLNGGQRLTYSAALAKWIAS